MILFFFLCNIPVESVSVYGWFWLWPHSTLYEPCFFIFLSTLYACVQTSTSTKPAPFLTSAKPALFCNCKLFNVCNYSTMNTMHHIHKHLIIADSTMLLLLVKMSSQDFLLVSPSPYLSHHHYPKYWPSLLKQMETKTSFFTQLDL